MKNYKALVYNEAKADYNEALKYYQNVSSAVAKKFRNAVAAAIKDIQKNPFYEVKYDDFRLKLVKKFLYLIHYIVNENDNTLYIYGIRNTSKDPNTSYFK